MNEIIVNGEKVSSEDMMAMAIKDFWKNIGKTNERNEVQYNAQYNVATTDIISSVPISIKRI